jgi:hypothetical protein
LVFPSPLAIYIAFSSSSSSQFRTQQIQLRNLSCTSDPPLIADEQSALDTFHEMNTKQIKAAASTKQIKAKVLNENIMDHDKAATGGGDQKQSGILLALNSEDFPPLDFSRLDLYRPGDEGLDDYVVHPGEDTDEVIYYGEE